MSQGIRELGTSQKRARQPDLRISVAGIFFTCNCQHHGVGLSAKGGPAMKLKVVGCICAIVVLLLSGFSLFAQTAGTGALTGTVTDPSGAVIANATVTVTNNGTGQARTAVTGTDGVYKFNLLPPGSYSVKFSAAGFTSVEVPAVEIVSYRDACIGPLPGRGRHESRSHRPSQCRNRPDRELHGGYRHCVEYGYRPSAHHP